MSSSFSLESKAFNTPITVCLNSIDAAPMTFIGYAQGNSMMGGFSMTIAPADLRKRFQRKTRALHQLPLKPNPLLERRLTQSTAYPTQLCHLTVRSVAPVAALDQSAH